MTCVATASTPPLLGVALRVAWRALILAGVDDDAVLPALEQVLISERKSEDVFATLAMVTVALDSGEAAVRLAGHPPPLLLAGGAAVTVPGDHGPVLGVFDNAEWPASRTPWSARTGRCSCTPTA